MQENRRVGLIGAMDEEIALLLEKMDQAVTQKVYQTTYYTGTLNGTPVVVSKSGVGKVNGAICTQVLIERFHVESIIFTGVAGALHPDLDIGDLVISTECQQHDLDASALGFPKGTIPFQETSVFPADPKLIEWAARAGEKLEGVQVRLGKVLSGDQFISDSGKVTELREQLGGDCVEMEGAAVAHVCHLSGTPFVVIRSMSDRADHSADVNFTEFTKLAAERSSVLVCEILEQRKREKERS
ncbi:5'-methylthioadenosine/adenosylhomocysteine nucleosidase [Thermoactinomyces sp. CICC 10523]|jgi:adenosylhomocysteine nucleosidase|uniref:5'-methylthioadenosine/adenosylhomocysteine nucleosidase n=1 Tax=Thermoactinomyces sp. CICC 10523 TaxID=2767428 RepID=UPI0018DDAD3C|nr:5'-methylthioadenosine/adenosylhomocysteine nucleosidase [Thermoactinomyces sp. CICC 10523]MBH8597122.1 5'-methylthioadenosine/adenosylhomocysteine nucleosidase [Thermoactinomyces sp. CICC 10523]